MYYFKDLIVPTYSVNKFGKFGKQLINFKAYTHVEIWTLFFLDCKALKSRECCSMGASDKALKL